MGFLSRKRREREAAPLPPLYFRPIDCALDRDVCVTIAAEAGGATWSRHDFDYWSRDNAVCLVAVYRHEIAGFVVFVPGSTTIAILHIAVTPELQLRGIGRLLLLAASMSHPETYRVPVVEVCETDTAVGFFRRCGFVGAGITRDYCLRRNDNRADPHRDAYIMRLPLESYDELRRPTITIEHCSEFTP